ncbi:MAG: glycosyltransferase family 39 protein [Gemmataceae bacterium]
MAAVRSSFRQGVAMTALPHSRLLLSPPADAPRLRLADVPATVAETFFARLLLGWLAVRTVAWTLLAWLQPNPALDTVEWLAWGQRWQLGYHKHPPLAAWVAEIACHLTPGSFLGLYLVGYLALAAALYAVWLVARELLPPREAFAAVVALDGLSYLGSYGCEYNNQVLLIAFWALTITFFYRGCTRERWTDWLAAGLMAGLALLCKYSTVTLLLPLLAWRVVPSLPLGRPGGSLWAGLPTGPRLRTEGLLRSGAGDLRSA